MIDFLPAIFRLVRSMSNNTHHYSCLSKYISLVSLYDFLNLTSQGLSRCETLQQTLLPILVLENKQRKFYWLLLHIREPIKTVQQHQNYASMSEY